MNILILGSGGREHAIADKVVSSPLCKRLFIAPGNAGTALVGHNVPIDINDFAGIKTLVSKEDIGLIIVGPEGPLVNGIVDFFQQYEGLKNVPIIGPSAEGAKLEGSKDYAKEFMQRHLIPTASHNTFENSQLEKALLYLEQHSLPIVLKADGLAAGKGVVICETTDEAKDEITSMLSGKFGEASSKVVVEQFLKGTEFSVFVLTDGNEYVLLPEAKDYKRVGEGDTGLNTGGMGAVSPVSFADDILWKKVKDQIIEPTIKGISDEKIYYKGFIFFGLIVVDGEPFVIEYNCRLGDPETEVILPRIKGDFVEILLATWESKLKDLKIEFDSRSAATIMLVSGGYPGDYEKGKHINGLDKVDGSRIYHAGTAPNHKGFLTSGGRVLAVTSMGSTMQRALDKSLRNAEVIDFEGKNYRKDIGMDI